MKTSSLGGRGAGSRDCEVAAARRRVGTRLLTRCAAALFGALALAGILTAAGHAQAPSTRMALLSPVIIVDTDVSSWAAAVVTNGGTVSRARLGLVSKLVRALKTAGSWQLTDDYWLLVAENPIQALTSLKQRRLATAVNSPVFTRNQGYTFDGTTSYLDTGFIPITHAVAMTATSAHAGGYARTAGVSGALMGVNQSSGRTIRVQMGTTTVNIDAQSGSAAYTFDNALGYYSGSRNGGTDASTIAAYENGAALVRTVAPTSFATTLPTIAIFIGGRNSAGSLISGYAGIVGSVDIGAGLSAAQELAQRAAIQSFMIAAGAGV